jgi:outer membrane assembly lipoprotein YfiO
LKTPVRLGYFRLFAVAAFILALAGSTAHAQWTWTPEVGRWVNPQRQPKETAALQFQYAEGFLAEGNTEKAIREYNKLLRYFSDSNYCDLAQYSIGRALEAQEKHDKAITAYQKVIDDYPDTQLFAKVLGKQQKIADYFFQRGVEKQKGFSLTRNADFEKAIDIYRALIDNQPFTEASAEAQYRMGLSYMKMERYPEAASEFQKLLDYYPTSQWTAEAAFGAAECRYNMALPHEYDITSAEESVEKFNSFLRSYPESSHSEEARTRVLELREVAAKHDYDIAIYYHRKMKYDSARYYFDSIVREYPETAWAEMASEKLGEMP